MFTFIISFFFLLRLLTITLSFLYKIPCSFENYFIKLYHFIILFTADIYWLSGKFFLIYRWCPFTDHKSFLHNFCLFLNSHRSSHSKFTFSQFFELLNSKDILIHSISIINFQDHSYILLSHIKWETSKISIYNILFLELYLISTIVISQISLMQHFFSLRLNETWKSLTLNSSILASLPLSLYIFHIQSHFIP